LCNEKKVKFTLEQAMKAKRVSTVCSSTLSLTSALDGEVVVKATPPPLYPWEIDLAPLALEAG